MDLLDVLHEIGQNNYKGMKPTDLAFGTVTGTSPLEITTETTMQALPEEALVLTDAVTLRTTELEIEGETYTIVLSEPLTVGERVIMLRCAQGQRYVVLSRVTGGV